MKVQIEVTVEKVAVALLAAVVTLAVLAVWIIVL